VTETTGNNQVNDRSGQQDSGEPATRNTIFMNETTRHPSKRGRRVGWDATVRGILLGNPTQQTKGPTVRYPWPKRS